MSIAIEISKKIKAEKMQQIYFEQGYQAASVPDGISLKPARANHNNQAAWQQGFNQAKQVQAQEKLKQQGCDKTGLKRLRDIIRDACHV